MKKEIGNFMRTERARCHLSQHKTADKLKFNRSNYARSELTGVISAENLLIFIAGMKVDKEDVWRLVENFKKAKDASEREKNLREILGNEEYERSMGITTQQGKDL